MGHRPKGVMASGSRAATIDAMELIEVKEKQRLSREDVAARLRELADQLARHNDVEFERSGVHIRVRVPDEVEFKFEFELEDDGGELELELSW
jgi:amphi-Trp domain-containing protein